ncbi:carbohydrate-binding module family 50 protein, partial [Cadophora sp. DSE1049]
MKCSISTIRRLFSRATTSTPRQLQATAVNVSTYTIKAGDTLATIASKSGMSVAALQQANPGINPNNLQVGQAIQLPQPGSRYTIQVGDTLSSIAAKVGSTVAALQAANPGVNPNNLQIGAQIVVPATSTPMQPAPPVPQPQPAPSGKYTIQVGDTFTTIAAKLGTTATALQAANPGINVPSTTQPNPGPVAPTPAPTGPSTSTYVIQAGDTFTTIAGKFNVSVAAIEAANPNVKPTSLQVGQTINLP